MTSKKNEIAPAPEAAPARSAARAMLANRLAAVEAARQKVQDREAAARRLTVIGETAQAIASDLTAQKQRDAERLVEYALNGNGRLPPLTDEARAQLYARLLEAEARAEGAVPALAIVNAEIAQAHADFVRANGAAQDMVVPVFEEELEVLRREIQVLNAKLIPLHIRLAGLRSWAAMKNAVKDGPEREPFHRLMVAATHAMQVGLVSDQTPTRGTESTVWGALEAAVVTDPDALAVPHAEAA